VPAGFEIPGCDDQHEALRWWPIDDALGSDQVHRFTRDYLPLLT